MKVAVRILVWLALILCAVAMLYLLDPDGRSKVHGNLLTVLAFIFLVQDALFWNFQRKVDDVAKSLGVPLADAEKMLGRSQRLKRYGWKLWGVTVAVRIVTLVAGQIQQHVDFSGESFGTSNYRFTWEFVVASIGYISVVVGALLTMKTYALFRHSEKVLAELDVQARQLAAGKEQAKEILAANTDWTKDSKLSEYRHIKLGGTDSKKFS